jgi:hypothetical protein
MGDGAAVGVAVGVGARVGVAAGAGVRVGVTVVEPHAARPTAAIAVPMMVVSFMAALTPRLRQWDVGREHPEGAYRRGG